MRRTARFSRRSKCRRRTRSGGHHAVLRGRSCARRPGSLARLPRRRGARPCGVRGPRDPPAAPPGPFGAWTEPLWKGYANPAAKAGNASRRLLRHLRRQVHRPALGRALLRSGLPPGCLPRAARAVEGVDGASRAVAGAEAAAQARRRGPARAEEAREARRCGQQSGPAIGSPTAGLAHPCGGRERTALPFERSRRDSSARARRSPSAAAVRCRQRRETSKGHGRSWRAGSLRELVRVHYSTG
jgi:hypothetical protein